MGDTMRAAVYRGRRTVAVEQVSKPAPGPGEVLIEISHCGICGTDLHFLMEGWAAPGTVHGHEYSGVVAAVGEGVGDRHVGDRVVGGPGVGCGECAACRRGQTNVCARRPRIGIDSPPGAFAEFKVQPAAATYPLPAELDLRRAALAEPVAVALRGVERAACSKQRAGSNSRVLVTGAGPIGMITTAILRARDVDVTVSEPNPARRELAAALGARAVQPGDLEPPTLPMDLARDPFDAAIECSGRPDAVTLALSQLDRGATLVLSGTGLDPHPIDGNRVILNELIVTGTCEYTPADFRAAIDLIATGQLPTDLLIEAVDVPLAGMQDALERLAAGETAGKVMVTPHA